MHTIQTSSKEEFTNELIHVVVERKGACFIEFQVTANKKMLEQARLNAAKAVSKEVVLPGFRKGKAPEAMVVKKFPLDVERQFGKSLADLAFVEAQKLVNIPVLNNGGKIVFDMKNSTSESANLVFGFETEPTIPSVDPKLFHPQPVEKKEVGETEINEAIRQMAFFYAKWEAVSDRPVEEGDFIMIDLDTIEGDEIKRVFNQVRFEVKPERMANWMRNLVLNAKAGDTVEGISEPDETASEEEKKEFTAKKVRVHISKVEKATLPEMDDEFANKVGAPNVAEMHKLVEGVLKTQVENKAQEALREQVNRFLVETYSFDLPSSLVQAEFEHRYDQQKQNPEFENYIKNLSDEKKKEVEAKIREETVYSLKLFYLSKQIVADAKISITHQEVGAKAVENRRSRFYGVDSKEKFSKEEYALALSMVFLSKAQDYIIEQQKA